MPTEHHPTSGRPIRIGYGAQAEPVCDQDQHVVAGADAPPAVASPPPAGR